MRWLDWLRARVGRRPRPAPWQDDLVGDRTLRALERRRGIRAVPRTEAELGPVLRDDVEAIRRERGGG